MTAPPAGALEACLALLEKATRGMWSQDTGGDITMDDGTTLFTRELPGGDSDVSFANADLVEAAVNLLKDHGPALLAALRLREGWRPISTGPKGSDEVVLLCDANGNRWTDCWPGLPVNGCGYPAVAYMPLPAPPTADDLARVLEETK